MARVKNQVFKSMQHLLSKIRACMQFFRKRAEKYKIFENLGKNVKGLNRFFGKGQVIA